MANDDAARASLSSMIVQSLCAETPTQRERPTGVSHTELMWWSVTSNEGAANSTRAAADALLETLLRGNDAHASDVWTVLHPCLQHVYRELRLHANREGTATATPGLLLLRKHLIGARRGEAGRQHEEEDFFLARFIIAYSMSSYCAGCLTWNGTRQSRIILKCCSRCKIALYCDKGCLKLDYLRNVNDTVPSHRVVCPVLCKYEWAKYRHDMSAFLSHGRTVTFSQHHAEIARGWTRIAPTLRIRCD